ncbi:MAG: single-stranded DNA-binding protein [Planctomycetota bacterium]|nr:single-stranded DNA-binding protein [Planctomycetota bacterium]
MANVNKVILIGNLTRDVELRAIAGGQSVGNFGLALNRNFTTKDGEKREEVTFVDCEAWGRTAEIMKQYLSKGRPVYVEGRLKLDSWEDKEGKKQSKLKVVVEEFQFLGSREGGENRGTASTASTGQSYADASRNSEGASGNASGGSHAKIQENDIPF